MSDLLLADDLSGALDAAGAFWRAGRRVHVILSAETWERTPDDDVVAVTTETRNASPEMAATAVTRALAHAHARGRRIVYKKIDSTLRGPVAAELAALAQALPGTRILFTPANPAVGRTVRDGVLLVRGVPVAQTEFARDPGWPVRESEIRRLLGLAATESVIIADVEVEADLERAVAMMARASTPWVAVGSGALARPVAARIGGSRAANARDELPIGAGPTLMIGGSAHPLNREQAAQLTREREVRVVELRLADPAAAIDEVAAALQRGAGAAMQIESVRAASTDVLRNVTSAAAEIISRCAVRRVFVTGGETAYALCRALGIEALTFGREIEPGLSVSCAPFGGERLWLAVKPGGFGDTGTWIRAWDSLRGGASARAV